MSHDAFAPDHADDVPFLAPPAVSRAGRMPPPLEPASSLPPPYVPGAAGQPAVWSAEPALETATADRAGSAESAPDGSWLEALDREPAARPEPRPAFELDAVDEPGPTEEPEPSTEPEAAVGMEPPAADVAAASSTADASADLPAWMAWIDDGADDGGADDGAVVDEATQDRAVTDYADLLAAEAAEPEATAPGDADAPFDAVPDDEDPLPVQDIEALLFEPEPAPPPAVLHGDAEDGRGEPQASWWRSAPPEDDAEPAPAAAPEPVDRAGGSETAAPDASADDELAPEEPSDEPAAAAEPAPEEPADEPATTAAQGPAPEPVAAAEAVFGSVVASGGGLPDAFSGVFHEVADRLDNIADSLRRQSRGDTAAAGRNTDPLELLLTGFVLGYIAREGKGPQRPSGGG